MYEASNLTERRLTNGFWLVLGCTLPLFAASFGRLDVGFMHIAIPMAVIGMIILVKTFSFLMSSRIETMMGSNREFYTVLGLLCFLFLMMHQISWLRSVDYTAALKEVLKLAMAYISFWGCILFFPRNKKFIDKFVRITLYSSAIFMAVLIYIYMIVFKVGYLGNELSEQSRAGKGQLTLYLACVAPYALFYFQQNKKNVIGVACGLIIMFSLIYGASRSSWFAIAAGVLYVVLFLLRFDRRNGVKLSIQLLCLVAIALGITLAIISQFGDTTEVFIRFLSIYDPQGIPDEYAYLGAHSYEVRGGTLSQAWTAFMSSPIIGVGLVNTVEYVDRITHNDYMTVLLEFGAIGFSLFLMLLLYVWIPVERRSPKNISGYSWVSLGARGSIMALLVQTAFINTYTSVHFWVFLGLYVVILDSEAVYDQNSAHHLKFTMHSFRGI